jgi:gluconokinase
VDERVTSRPAIVVVMGAAGCGKTTIGQLLAERLGVVYAEADSFHPPANVAKMASGQALDDDDRYPWLRAIADWIRARSCAGEGAVVSCSALKYRYRDLLRQGYAKVWFLHLEADPDLITRRVAERSGHFMPASLVNSQFQALEPLRPDEAGAVVDASASPEGIVRTAVARLSGDHASG